MFFNISVNFKILKHKQSNNVIWKNSALHKIPVLDSQAAQILELLSSSLQQPFIIHFPLPIAYTFQGMSWTITETMGYNTNVSDTKPDV